MSKKATSSADVIRFSKNWNNKLSNEYMTTIRLFNVNKYKVGKFFNLILNTSKNGNSAEIIYTECVCVKCFVLSKLTDPLAYVDAGMDAKCLGTMLKRMYKYKHINWTKQVLMLIVLRNINYKD